MRPVNASRAATLLMYVFRPSPYSSGAASVSTPVTALTAKMGLVPLYDWFTMAYVRVDHSGWSMLLSASNADSCMSVTPVTRSAVSSTTACAAYSVGASLASSTLMAAVPEPIMLRLICFATCTMSAYDACARKVSGLTTDRVPATRSIAK